MSRTSWLWVGLAASAAAGGLAAAQDQYRGLPFPPDEVYEAMVRYAEDANFRGLSSTLVYVRPLASALKSEFGQDPAASLSEAVRQRDAAKAQAAVRALILLDLRFNLSRAGAEEEPERRRDRVAKAFVDYGCLSPHVKRLDRALDRRLRDEFRRLYRSEAAETRSAGERLVAELAARLGEPAPPRKGDPKP